MNMVQLKQVVWELGISTEHSGVDAACLEQSTSTNQH